ncbi:MAG: restriction endonuclease subunit S, partial [Erysipelotrichaceae bacterium]
ASIEQQRVCFEYSRKLRPKRMKNSSIMLPVRINEQSIPDFEFMEKFSLQIYLKDESKYTGYATQKIKALQYCDVPPLAKKKWEEFYIKDLFPNIQRGKRLIKAKQETGTKPYVSSTALNNGVDNFITNEAGVRVFSNCLTIANSGSVGASFYHPYEFVASDHVTSLMSPTMNEFVYLFISTLTNRLSEKYNFNREINDKRISREKIMLPVDENKKPDFEFMEQYAKNQMLSLYMRYLNKHT